MNLGDQGTLFNIATDSTGSRSMKLKSRLQALNRILEYLNLLRKNVKASSSGNATAAKNADSSNVNLYAKPGSSSLGDQGSSNGLKRYSSIALNHS